MSTIEDNKIIARQWFKLISEHRIEEICEMTDPNWKMHGGPPNLSSGPDGVRELFEIIGPSLRHGRLKTSLPRVTKLSCA